MRSGDHAFDLVPGFGPGSLTLPTERHNGKGFVVGERVSDQCLDDRPGVSRKAPYAVNRSFHAGLLRSWFLFHLPNHVVMRSVYMTIAPMPSPTGNPSRMLHSLGLFLRNRINTVRTVHAPCRGGRQ